MFIQNQSIQQELSSVEHGKNGNDFCRIWLGHSVEVLRLGEPDWPTVRFFGRSFGSPLTSALTGVLTPTRQVTARYPCRGAVCCGGMSEKEPHSVTPRPEQILTSQEAEVLQKAEAGVLPCPWCGQMLRAEMIVSGDYEGVVLSCPDGGGCGFREC